MILRNASIRECTEALVLDAEQLNSCAVRLELLRAELESHRRQISWPELLAVCRDLSHAFEDINRTANRAAAEFHSLLNGVERVCAKYADAPNCRRPPIRRVLRFARSAGPVNTRRHKASGIPFRVSNA